MRPPESTMQLEDDDVVTPPGSPSASASASATVLMSDNIKAPRGALPLDVVEQVLDTVTAMRTQELTTYRRCDYLDSQEGRLQTVLDASWRQRIVEWMYGVVDHCSLRRDSVATASVYLDICVQRGLVKTREEYQLAAMTALQIAIKLCDSTVVKLQSMVALGRGLFTAQDVIDMERKMLATLNWNCHPPTSVCFLRQFLRLLPSTVPPYTRYMIAEVTRYVSVGSRFAKMTIGHVVVLNHGSHVRFSFCSLPCCFRFIAEISVCLYRFVKYPPSTLAFAGMIIAMDRFDDASLSPVQLVEVYAAMARVGMDAGSAIVQETISALRQSLENNASMNELFSTMNAQSPNSSPDSKLYPKSLRNEFAPPGQQSALDAGSCHMNSPRDVTGRHS